jgi:hypothetical protein
LMRPCDTASRGTRPSIDPAAFELMCTIINPAADWLPSGAPGASIRTRVSATDPATSTPAAPRTALRGERDRLFNRAENGGGGGLTSTRCIMAVRIFRSVSWSIAFQSLVQPTPPSCEMPSYRPLAYVKESGDGFRGQVRPIRKEDHRTLTSAEFANGSPYVLVRFVRSDALRHRRNSLSQPPADVTPLRASCLVEDTSVEVGARVTNRGPAACSHAGDNSIGNDIARPGRPY